ncbi:hypothetical protein AB0H76_06975 [Nocardia sp. NPDC050712]|uniref:hypothetical protein n=1 Tax=Nocardia sp. NPDC050712 TaxID=3155518 RepID=UPI0033DBA678
MKVRRWLPVGIALCALFTLSTACSEDDSEKLRKVSECGNFVFPDDVNLIWYRREVMTGDAIAEAVVDIPAAGIEEFKQRSVLSKFDPGVPPRWRESFWQGSGQDDLLASEAGNIHLVEPNQTPPRWVVLHDNGSDARVFVRAAC